MQTWPNTLDIKPLADGYSEPLPRTILRTPMDAGPANVRRQISISPRLIPIEIPMTAAEVEDFDEFFMETLLGGALMFTWTHPRTGDAIDSRILVDAGNGPELAYHEGDYLVRFILEVLP